MDDALVRRFSTPVSRYTSYPTAPHFHAGVGTTDYRRWLARIGADQSVSLYFHVPFCAGMCWFCGCHTRVTHRDAPLTDYAVRHVHWGGGTLDMLTPEVFRWLMDRV